MSHQESSSASQVLLEAGIAAHNLTRLSLDRIQAMRKTPNAFPGEVATSVLRHCEDQTISALAAVKTAIGQLSHPPATFDNWGVLVSSRSLGRVAFAQSLAKFAVEGPWNVSVQVVPHRSLHSPASMLGLSLGCHGPCLGVGGGLDGETDAWLTAVSLLQQQVVPGLWVVFTGWEPEAGIDAEGIWQSDTTCTALALALQPAAAPGNILRMRFGFADAAPEQLKTPPAETMIRQFERFLTPPYSAELNLELGGGLHATFQRTNAATRPIDSVMTLSRKAA